MQLLEKLNIYGLNGLEDIIISGLVTGDPVLLIGRHGTAKTLLARRLAQALQLNFIAYDASKALFDDVVGFPNPKSLAEGKVDYIPTPISIWDKEFILIDEISRATPSMQNKWLEVIRSRQLMGKKIPGLKYIFAAMNPPVVYAGANPLDHALAGRFAFVISIPEVYQMNSDEIKKVINNISEDDAVVLDPVSFSNSVNSEFNTGELKTLVSAAQELLPEISKKYNDLVVGYTTKILISFQLHKVKLDGRRLGMLRRNCLAYLAVKTTKYGCEDTEKNLSQHLYECLKYSLPNEATGETLRADVIKSIHISALNENSSFTKLSAQVKIFQSDTSLEMVEKYITLYDDVSVLEHNRIISAIESRLKSDNSAGTLVDIYLAIRKLLKFYLQNGRNYPVDVIRRAVDLYMQLIDITRSYRNIEIYEDIFRQYGSQTYPFVGSASKEINFQDEISDIAFRLCINSNRKNSYATGITYDFYKEIKAELEKFYQEGKKDETIRPCTHEK